MELHSVRYLRKELENKCDYSEILLLILFVCHFIQLSYLSLFGFSRLLFKKVGEKLIQLNKPLLPAHLFHRTLKGARALWQAEHSGDIRRAVHPHTGSDHLRAAATWGRWSWHPPSPRNWKATWAAAVSPGEALEVSAWARAVWAWGSCPSVGGDRDEAGWWQYQTSLTMSYGWEENLK